MLENRNTENPPLDCEDWQIAFKPYSKYPYLALALAQHLSAHYRTAYKAMPDKPQPQLTVP